MIPPLQLDLAQLRQIELRREADQRRLVRQANRDAAHASTALPRRTRLNFRKLSWVVLRTCGALFDHRPAVKAMDR